MWSCVGKANPHLSHLDPAAVLPFGVPIRLLLAAHKVPSWGLKKSKTAVSPTWAYPQKTHVRSPKGKTAVESMWARPLGVSVGLQPHSSPTTTHCGAPQAFFLGYICWLHVSSFCFLCVSMFHVQSVIVKPVITKMLKPQRYPLHRTLNRPCGTLRMPPVRLVAHIRSVMVLAGHTSIHKSEHLSFHLI